MSLERACSGSPHWANQQYHALFQTAGSGIERLALVVDGSVDLVAFLVARHLAPEWELENIVVAASARRMGWGKQLLERLLMHARETNSEAVFLEVRESNLAARTLYEHSGFAQTGRRKSYYTNPDEDALLYRCTLP